MCCAVTTHATVYEASTVTMKTSNADYSMSLLGETSDGYQIWACQAASSSSDLKGAEWQIDGGKTISFPVNYFSTNAKWSLQTSSVKTYENYERNLRVNAENQHFLKVKSQTTADFFTWDMTETPKFISEFTLAGGLSASIDGGSSHYGVNNKTYVHKLTWAYSGMTSVVVDRLTIELSYDKGKTWTSAGEYAGDASSIDVQLPLDKESVRYRVTAYPKDAYKIVADKDCYVAETSDYDISSPTRVIYNASKVIMNTGSGNGTDISMTKLGVCKDGYQLWVCQGIDDYAYTKWYIDDGGAISYSYGDFFSNTQYMLTEDYTTTSLRYVPQGSKHYHFVKPKGKVLANYFTWYGTEAFKPFGYYLSAKCTVGTNSGIYLDNKENRLKQALQWNFKNVSVIMIDHVDLEMSLDGGETWENVSTQSSGVDDPRYYSTGASCVAYIGEKATKVRYRVTVYPKDCYKCVVENGYWRAETEDYPVTLPDVTCSIKAVALDRDAYNQDATTKERTYVAEVSWTALEEISDKFGGAEIQYSVDNGDTWTTTDTVTVVSGTQKVNVPTGYTNYMFRINPYAKAPWSEFAAYRPTAESDALTTDYAPAVKSLSVAGKADDLTYGQFRKVTLDYSLNDDLAQTCSRAYMAYSYDNGATWIKMKGFVPASSGQQTILTDASKSQCKFRILVNSVVDGTNKPCTFETDNISLN